MPHVLPNFNDTVVQKYGIPEIYAAFPDLFKDRDPSEKPTIAVIDQGVDMTENRYDIWKNAAEIPSNGIDDDGNGFIDDAFGYNFYPIADFGIERYVLVNIPRLKKIQT